MTTQARAQVKSEQGCAKRQGIEGRDITGIALGVTVSLAGLLLVFSAWQSLHAFEGLSPVFYLSLGVGMILLLISVGLFIPCRHYEWGITRIVGFAIAVLPTGVSVLFAALAGYCAYYLFLDGHDDFAPFFGTAGLAAFGLTLGCTFVLFKKLDAERVQTATAITAGIVVGSSPVLAMYLLHFFE